MFTFPCPTSRRSEQLTVNANRYLLAVLRFRLTRLSGFVSRWPHDLVERRSLAGELSLYCAWPAADGWVVTTNVGKPSATGTIPERLRGVCVMCYTKSSLYFTLLTVQTVSDVYLTRICLLDTSACSTLGVLDDNCAIYKSTYLLTSTQAFRQPFYLCRRLQIKLKRTVRVPVSGSTCVPGAQKPRGDKNFSMHGVASTGHPKLNSPESLNAERLYLLLLLSHVCRLLDVFWARTRLLKYQISMFSITTRGIALETNLHAWRPSCLWIADESSALANVCRLCAKLNNNSRLYGRWYKIHVSSGSGRPNFNALACALDTENWKSGILDTRQIQQREPCVRLT